jgi:hypothetical protein
VIQALLLTGAALGAQPVVDGLPQLGVDRWLVVAGILDAADADDARMCRHVGLALGVGTL